MEDTSAARLFEFTGMSAVERSLQARHELNDELNDLPPDLLDRLDVASRPKLFTTNDGEFFTLGVFLLTFTGCEGTNHSGQEYAEQEE